MENLQNSWRHVDNSNQYLYVDFDRTCSLYRITKNTAGKKRELYVADETTKKWLVPIRIELELLYSKRIKANVSYGFRKKFNCALNATQHVGYNYTLSYDFKNFFSSIKPFHVSNYINKSDISFLFVDNHLPQGLTTSPVVSNIAMIDFDETITHLLRSLDSKIIFTRYVDDINISFDDISLKPLIDLTVTAVTNKFYLAINEHKTRFHRRSRGNVVINGISTTGSGVEATRKTRRKIRAAMHQGKYKSAISLTNWAKCLLPKE
ncbi:MAG: RNA-directed DNA polymerase [Oceanospirillaceae bacterium]|jgi:RNA-directed DNA polymerase